jgi:tetratricopeptide (TPR) repeat protein
MKHLIFSSILFAAVLISFQVSAQEKAAADLKASLTKARLLSNDGKLEEASKIYTGIMKTDPDNQEAVQGWLIINMKRTPTGEKDAILLLDSLGRVYPRNTGILFFKSFLEVEHSLYKEALSDVEKLVAIHPDSVSNWILKGQILGAMKNYKEAAVSLGHAAELSPERADVWSMKGAALAETGMFDEALVSANKGIELAPGNALNYYNRACIYSLKGDYVNAIADLKKSLEINPSLRENARKDEDFKSLFDNAEFKNLTK